MILRLVSSTTRFSWYTFIGIQFEIFQRESWSNSPLYVYESGKISCFRKTRARTFDRNSIHKWRNVLRSTKTTRLCRYVISHKTVRIVLRFTTLSCKKKKKKNTVTFRKRDIITRILWTPSERKVKKNIIRFEHTAGNGFLFFSNGVIEVIFSRLVNLVTERLRVRLAFCACADRFMVNLNTVNYTVIVR